MADLISLEEISAQIESTDYSNPANVEELRRLLERADAAYAVSNQYDQFIDVRKKYEEKIRNPQASQEPGANSGTDRRFDEIKGNQEKREFLEAKINREGDLVLSPNERAFLAEQIANGSMYDQLQDGEKILKIARALDGEGLEKTVRDNVLRQLEKPDQTMMPADKAFVPDSNNSFGEQILKDLASAAPKDEMADLQQQVARLTANVEAYGETQGNMSARRELIGKIRELQENAKGILNFNNRRKLNNQLKKVDPAYYDTKIVHASGLTVPYYRVRAALRDWNAKRNKNKTKSLETRHQRVTELQDVIHQNAFWSRNMGTNIKARFKLIRNCLAEGRLTAQGVTQKYAKRLNLTQTAQQLDGLEAKLTELNAQMQAAENPQSRARLQKQIQAYEAQKAAFSSQSEKVSGRRKDKIGNISTQAEPVKQNIRERLQKMAANLEKDRIRTVKSSDRYKALTVLQSRGGLTAEQKKELDAIVNGLTEKAITAENVYEKILLESGVKGDELASKVAELFPPREADERQQQTQTPNRDVSETEEIDKKKTERQNNDETRTNAVVTHEERRDGEVVKTYASGLEVYQPDENTYNISGEGGKNPTDEQCAEFVNQLKQDNYESFSVDENVSPEFYASMVRAAEAAGLTIENKEKMDQKFQEMSREGMGGDGRAGSGERNDTGERTDNGGKGDKKEEKEPYKLRRNKDGHVMLTEAQIMALDSEGRLDFGGLRQQFKFDKQGKIIDGPSYASFAEKNPQHAAYLEELGLGEQHVKDMLKKEASENNNLTEAQIQALDAEGRLDMGGKEKTYTSIHSQDRAYLEEEGLGKDYKRKAEISEFMADSNLSAKDITIEKMDLLMEAQNKKPEEFEEFKKSEKYRKLPAEQRKLVNAVNALANNQEFKSKDERKQAVVLGRLVGRYKASVEGERNPEEKQKIKQRFIDRNITRHLAAQGKSNG